MRLILASTSPRRKELLSLLRVPFEVMAPIYTERAGESMAHGELVQCLARAKAQSCASRFPDALVLGSDTLISVDGETLGKPVNPEDARAMLVRLKNRSHVVSTAIALLRECDGFREMAVETTRVWMRDLTEAAIQDYLHTSEGMGKAGAYAIQGAGGHLIDRIEGDFTAVVGLPLRQVCRLLQLGGVKIPVEVATLYREKPYPNWSRFSSEPNVSLAK